MSYDQYDLTTQGGDPVFLLQANYGDDTYRLTNQARDVVALGFTWTATPGLSFGAIMQTNELARDLVNVTFPINNTFAQIYINDIQDVATSVTLFRGYSNDPEQEFITYWKGRIASGAVQGKTVILKCEPIFTSLKRAGLRARYQRSCRHVLYSEGCNLTLDDSQFAYDGTITVAGDLTFTIPEAAESFVSDGFFRGGILRAPDGIKRFISDHSGTQISIRKPHVGLIATAEVTLYPGCDRTMETCINRFDNLNNFGGFPYIPTKNPFGGSSIY